jgi:hypothetical protein
MHRSSRVRDKKRLWTLKRLIRIVNKFFTVRGEECQLFKLVPRHRTLYKHDAQTTTRASSPIDREII